MRRYYIEHTGYCDGRAMGVILNEDGTEYTGDMTDQSFSYEDIENDLPTLVVDGHDIKITAVKKDAEHQPNAKVDLVFYQDREDGKKKAVASLRMSNVQLKDLNDTIYTKQNDFTK